MNLEILMSGAKAAESMIDESQQVALVTGGSSGLGFAIAKAFAASKYQVVIVGRNSERLSEAAADLGRLSPSNCPVIAMQADVSKIADVNHLIRNVVTQCQRLDVLVNCVGVSDRGLIENLQVDHLNELIEQNVLTALLCSQAAIPMLEKKSGVIVNIGSLAGKVGARYVGGYGIAKHALSGLTQQLRLELRPRGIHVALVSPGPIRRGDEGIRYQSRIDESLPDQASAPGAGTRVKGLDPDIVAAAVLRCAQNRSPDLILPSHLRLLISVGHLFPRLGDWLLMKFTSGK